MNTNSSKTSFYAVGLSYKKADAETRGKFSLTPKDKEKLLEEAALEGIKSLMVISTCNRTELYGFADHPFQLISLLCNNTKGSVDNFQQVGYIHKNNDAVTHLFRVGTGMDSQILGDFEIIGQVKSSFVLSKEKNITDAFLERLINAVIQASKRIKNETQISTGATSVSFASVQYIVKNIADVTNKNILLFGLGKIGRNTCENLVKHTKNKHITLINRTRTKAEEIAVKFNLLVKDYETLQQELQDTDILIVATGADKPTVCKSMLENIKKPLCILDLSIPKNVDENVSEIEGVTLIHLDKLSKMTDDTIEKRKQYVPKALDIIDEVKNDFILWTRNRRFAPAINGIKAKLEEIKLGEIDYQRKKIDNFDEEQASQISNRIIQKITTLFANHLKDSETVIDDSVDLIEKIFNITPIKNE